MQILEPEQNREKMRVRKIANRKFKRNKSCKLSTLHLSQQKRRLVQLSLMYTKKSYEIDLYQLITKIRVYQHIFLTSSYFFFCVNLMLICVENHFILHISYSLGVKIKVMTMFLL